MEKLQTIQSNPLFNFMRPRLEKMGAGKLAEWLNQRRRKRLGIPDPVPEGCPPVDFSPEDCPDCDSQRKSGLGAAVSSGVIGIALGAAAGFFIAQQRSAE